MSVTSPLEKLKDLVPEPPAHDIRNRIEYEGDSEVEERFVKDLVVATQAVATALDKNGFPRPRE